MVAQAIAHPEERETWLAVALAIAPRARTRPSSWIATNIRLTSKQTGRPGPFNTGHKPWTRALLDRHFDNPHKKGVIAPKPSQVGFSFSMVALMLCLAATELGPQLYVTDIHTKAADYKHRWFDSWIQQSPELSSLFSDESQGKNRELTTHVEYVGGSIDFTGATESGVTSQARRFAFLDEFQAASLNYSKSSSGGDLWVTTLGRFPEYKDSCGLYAFSHPRFPDEDIHAKFMNLSDQAAWSFDCPRCAGVVSPSWECVKFEALEKSPAGEEVIDPDRAVFRCPCCGEVITDAERAAATWPVEKGGSGRFESPLADEVAARREYLGAAVNRLADPEVTVRELAMMYVGALADGSLQSFFNKILGEVYRSAGVAITQALVDQRLARQETILLPGGPLGAHILVAGADVQAPESNPTFYLRVAAFTATGMELVVEMVKIKGWAALLDFVRNFSATRVGEDGRAGSDKMGVQCLTIDCGAFTKQVLDNCRLTVYSAATGGQVILLPVRFQPHVKSTAPMVLPNEAKRIDPMRPYLGVQERYDLHRHTYVDREMRRWIDGRIQVLCEAPPDLAMHVTANVLVPVRDIHTWDETGELEWMKMKGRRDDWAMAGAYGEVGALAKCGLSEVHLRAAAAGVGEAPTEPAKKPWMGQRGNWWGR